MVSCSPSSVAWVYQLICDERRNMPAEERISFTNAVQCLQQKPSRYPEIEAAKSLFDDFVVLHWNLTGFHHFSV